MLIKDLPTKRKEVILYKIQVCDQNLLTWKELPKAYSTLESAQKTALAYRVTGHSKGQKTRIMKRSDKGWEVIE